MAQLRETAHQERAKLKKAELELEKWSEQSRKLQAEAESHNQEVLQLKQEKQRSQDTINRSVCVTALLFCTATANIVRNILS